MISYEEQVYWHTNSYGQAIRLPRKTLQTAAIILCLLTPATNWAIPLLNKLIKKDFVFRYT
ncbi:MAG: hypothetical protein ACMXYD_05355 [Candidatus Woesearchaeota archaeon]